MVETTSCRSGLGDETNCKIDESVGFASYTFNLVRPKICFCVSDDGSGGGYFSLVFNGIMKRISFGTPAILLMQFGGFSRLVGGIEVFSKLDGRDWRAPGDSYFPMEARALNYCFFQKNTRFGNRHTRKKTGFLLFWICKKPRQNDSYKQKNW